jgi:hypothetical protein
MDVGLFPSSSSSSLSMVEHWKESLEDMAKTLTDRNNENKERSKALGARLDQKKGYMLKLFRSKRSVGVQNETERDSEGKKG